MFMKTLTINEIEAISGGVGTELNNAEMGNAYMMATSAFTAGAGAALFNAYAASIASMPVWGAVATAGVVGVGTGLGVWAGYQLYYALNG